MKNTPNWTRGSCIGKGSFGTVNLAVDKFNGEVFAVKSANTTADISFSALENEIQILKSLSSPYIVAYRGDDVTVESNSIVYKNLHMEYMPGGTVADVGKHGYDDVTIRSYTKSIVSALSYIHARNIVHCDVKGRNVLVGEIPGSAKLADFGSAIDLSCENKGIRGSPLWMAPEVVRGEYQGPESDVWSLGCTVIEMITGQPAWLDRGVDTLCQIGYSNDLPNLPACISDELRDFLDKCLRRDRSERWSCEELLQHPYLLSCTSFSPKFGDKKWSPKSVFDWSDLNFSEEESQIENSDTSSTSANAKQRIGKLCSNVAPNWESDGWEVVRTETVTTSQPSSSVNDLTVTEREMICTPPGKQN
ncbi:serine/threonine-protein kinase Rad53 [Artemisia annua]|uniref:Serine/threonine-protein kinase Rad53 n=1 Tax=Artemisia annua TaxID=35608 RepID=A0A2U1NRT2_ARTAN|nr:serine/threonine-protein kinase Rad53 [Artemisia annua]